MQKKIRVVIVDDSSTMRGLIASVLRAADDIEIVGTAQDPFEARDVIKQTSPDVLTLDVEMPRMDGITFLEKLMRLRPMPVIMLSTLTEAGADASVRALSLGAFECVPKPNGQAFAKAMALLPDLIRAASTSKIANAARANPSAGTTRPSEFTPNGKLIAMGSSTGGVEALTAVLSSFPANCPPTVITQHMPPNFTRTLASRLDGMCAPTIVEATDGLKLQTGHVYIAPGGDSHMVVSRGMSPVCTLRAAPPENGHCPSVDVLFRSVARAYGDNAVGVILTGMGRDGADGLKAMRDAGAVTFGQDEETSIVYGMPKVAAEIGAVAHQMPLNKIAGGVLTACNKVSASNAA